MNKEEIIYEYEQILQGQRDTFSSKVFKPTRDGQKDFDAKNQSIIERQQNARTIIKYAFELLDWSEEEIKNCINFELLSKLKIYASKENAPEKKRKNQKDQVNVLQYVGYPDILDPDSEKDLKYLVSFIYNGTWGYVENDIIMEKYQNWLNGERLPSRFFDDDYVLSVCVQYYLSRYLPTESEDWYDIASNKELSKEFLDNSKLRIPARERGWDALDLLHKSLPIKYRNDWKYYHIRFEQDLRRTIARNKRENKEE